MKTQIEPLPTLDPLTEYLSVLECVTRQPEDEGKLTDLLVKDVTLTSRAHLYAEQNGERGKGCRVVGFERFAISNEVAALAGLARYEPGSQEYIEEYDRRFRWFYGAERGVGLTSAVFGPTPLEKIRPDAGRLECRQKAARAALISLGGKLATSGAFAAEHIPPAYQAIAEGIDAIGEHDQEFTRFGLHRIRRDLLNEYWDVLHSPDYVPLPKGQAKHNINVAWSITGKPFGLLSKLIGSWTARPSF